MTFSKTFREGSCQRKNYSDLNKELFQGRVQGEFTVENVGYSKAVIKVEAENQTCIPGVFIETDGYIAMDAIHYCRKEDTEKGGFKILSPYGRSGSAIKVFPTTADFLDEAKRPFVEYQFKLRQNGSYNVCFYLAPTTPVTFEREQYLGYSVNEKSIQIINTVEKPDIPFFLSPQWAQEARNNISRLWDNHQNGREGINSLFLLWL